MNTETTEHVRGWICYDAECAFCTGWAERTRNIFLRRGFHLVPLQAGWVADRLNLKSGAVPNEMKLLTADGRVYGGADAVVELSRSIWWGWPFFLLAHVPGMRSLLRAGYRWIASNRLCLKQHCAVEHRVANGHHHGTSSFYEMP